MVNRNIKLVLVAMLLLLNIGFVLALSVNSPYYKNNPLEMYPGQEREILFNMQNCPSLLDSCDKEDIEVVVSLEEGSEIAKIVSGENYKIDYGTSDSNIRLKVNIPDNTAIGTEYLVKILVSADPKNSGSVQLGLKYNVEFPVVVKDASDVEVVPETVASSSQIVNMIIVVIVLSIIILVILLWVLFNRNESNLEK